VNQQINNKSQKTSFNQKEINLSIRFGNPKSEDCQNFGLCKIESFNETIEKFQIRPKYAFAKLTVEDNQVQLRFLKSSMTSNTQQQYFGKGNFLIEEETTTKKRFGRTIRTVTWKPGKYRITEDDLYLIISTKNIRL